MAKSAQYPTPLPPGVPVEGLGAPSGNDDAPPPPFGHGKVLDPGGPVPRIVKELDRAPKGLTRFKMRCDNYARQVRYVLAENLDSAKKCYASADGLDKELDRLRSAGADKVDPARFVVVELAD